MNKNIIYIFLAILASTLVLQSCGIEEPFDTTETNDEYVEFVARPVGFNNNQNVDTKAQANDFENAIYKCYFLLFDLDPSSDNFGKVVERVEAQPAQSLKIKPEGLTKVKACFLANVSEEVIKDISTTEDLEEAISIVYSDHTAEDLNVETAGILGIPSVDFGGSIGKQKCIPMFGEEEFDDLSSSGLFTITMTRLFAKVIVRISVDLTNSIISSPNAFYDLKSYSLTNLPKKVNLNTINVETGNSSWYQTTDEGYFEDEVTVHLQDAKVYDADADNSKKKSHSFYFYVPEYILQPTEYKNSTYENNTDNQKYKSDLIPENSRPIRLAINGILRDRNNKDTSINYFIYLGGDAYDDFRTMRNTCYTHNISILGTDHITDEEAGVEIPPLNLVDMYNQSANCYIISNSGTYQLDTYRGVIKNITASTGKLTGKPKATPIWNDSDNTIDIINDENGSNEDKIIFTVNGETPGEDVSVGNALLALTDDKGNILWSWHIWFNESDNRADVEENLDKYPGNDDNWNNVYMMNRALGATSVISLDIASIFPDINGFLWRDGLYYQWGRKDPFRKGSINVEDNGDYNASKHNPTTLYSNWTNTMGGWTDSKSVNDPCPPGYRVPIINVWRSSNPDAAGITLPLINTQIQTTTSIAYTYNLALSGEVSPFVFYPYSGNHDADGEFINQIHIDDSDYTPDEEAYHYEYDVPAIGEEYGRLSTRPQTCRKFKKIKYDYEADISHGFLWASNGMLKYGYSILDMKNNSNNLIGSFFEDQFRTYTCDYMQGNVKYKSEGSGLRKKYIVEDIEWDEWKENQSIEYNVLGSNGYYVVKESLKKYLEDLKSISAYTYLVDTNIIPALGCAVRCVKENSAAQ